MAIYYNDADPAACAWLRELIAVGLLPAGYVDERSILEVEPADLRGFAQCHFFAGIGGWPYALRLAGVAESLPVWTGSPPCQPFSQAGQRKGQDDDRHLAPAFLRLVAVCRPELVFGEQAVSAGIFHSVALELDQLLDRFSLTGQARLGRGQCGPNPCADVLGSP